MKNKRNIRIDGDENAGELGEQEINSQHEDEGLNLENTETIEISGKGNSLISGGQKISVGSSPQQVIESKTILFLSAQPDATAALRLDKEFRDIKQALGPTQNNFALEACWATRPADFLQALIQFQPSILHFSGHGDADSNLAFEDETGGVLGINGSTLLEVLDQHAPELEGVLLNACHSATLAEKLGKHFDWAIGMEGRVRDIDALHFAKGFYAGLSQGIMVEKAYHLGKQLAQMHRQSNFDQVLLFHFP